MPHVERASGLIAVWEQTRQQEEIQLRRGGTWFPVIPVVSHCRADTLTLLSEASNRNSLIPFPIQGKEEEEVWVFSSSLRERSLFSLHAQP